jgi:RimJ/RimL family protein N-acetyltransferase
MPGYSGKGYATEGSLRALQAAYQDFGWRTAVSVVVANNSPSIAVAKRIGATQESVATLRGVDAYIFRHRTPTNIENTSRPKFRR